MVKNRRHVGGTVWSVLQRASERLSTEVKYKIEALLAC